MKDMKRKIYLLLGLWLFTHLALSQNCHSDTVVTSTIPEGNTITIKAANSIEGINIVSNGASATYDAGLEVILSPGFDALNGSTFTTQLTGCRSTGNTSNDTYFPLQWGHVDQIGTLEDFNGNDIPNPGKGANILGAWETTEGSAAITVAIIDSGFDKDHQDLDTGRVVAGYNFLDDNDNYDDIYGHGSLVTGILSATANSEG